MQFFEYLRNMVYFLVFVTVAGMLAPAGRYRKFVRLVTGFILIAVMVAPLAGFGTDIPITQWFAGILPGQAAPTWDYTHEAIHDRHLRAAFEAQLEAQLANMLVREGVSVQFATFEYTPDFLQITEIHVVVTESDTPRRIPVIRIEPIRWRDRQAQPTYCAVSARVRTAIAQFYSMPEANIYVRVEEETP
jgi:stage III sporulation protein AF